MGRWTASSGAAPPGEHDTARAREPRAAMASRMRSIAPAHAWIAPLVIASGVLSGNPANAPSVRRSPAVPRSSERRMSAGPGTMRPPRKRPSAVSASMVSAVPAFTTSLWPGPHVVRGDERRPAVGAQLRGVAIAVGDAELLGAASGSTASVAAHARRRRARARAAPAAPATFEAIAASRASMRPASCSRASRRVAPSAIAPLATSRARRARPT